MVPQFDTKKPMVSGVRFYIGAAVFIFGFLTPLFIPLVTLSNLSIAWKTGISGLLAFGIPEIFMLLAVAIMGKEGYVFLKTKIGHFFKPFAPKYKVGTVRYKIGLFLFTFPLIVGWILPYLVLYFENIDKVPLWAFVTIDAAFLSSFFVLGGEFWDKFRALFINRPKPDEEQ